MSPPPPRRQGIDPLDVRYDDKAPVRTPWLLTKNLKKPLLTSLGHPLQNDSLAGCFY